MFERERSFDLVHVRKRVREWMHVAEIVIHHPFFGWKELTPSNGFPTKMSQNAMISNQIRPASAGKLVFSKLEK